MRTRYLVAGAVVAVGAAAVVAAGLPAGGEDPVEAAFLPPGTAQVTRQTLVDTESMDGELGYGDTTEHKTRLSGTVTALAAAGSVVSRGRALYRIDNDPVVLLYGSLPAYRTLAAGDEGKDVKQFEKNLWALGYRGFTVDKSYTSATADAVREWQEDLGLGETGTVGPARIVYATGKVRVKSRAAAPGDVVQPGTALLSTTGTGRVATVSLDVSQERLARKGAQVTVTLPDGKEVKGAIAEVEPVVTPGDEQREASTTFDVTVGGFSSGALDQAAVTVALTAAERENVLTVPVAVLLALS